jgi:hypothetical protein
MADDIILNAGSGGSTVATDDIGGKHHQRVKLSVGADGAASDAVPVSNGMDVTGAAVQAVGIVGQFDDSATGAVTEDQFAPVRISTRRALLVEGVASGTAVPVSGTVTANAGSGTQAVSLASVPSHDVTNAGTFAVQAVGNVAHDAVDSGAPVKVGGKASAAAPTSVAGADRVDAWFLLNGAQATVVTAAGALIGGDATNGLDVDVTRVIPGTTATALGKAEDAAHTTGDTGVMALAVRKDTLAASSGTTGDYEPLGTDSLGALWTRDTSILVDDAAFTPATSRVLPGGFFADETATDSVNEGDIGAGRMTLDRKQIVTPQPHTAGGLSTFMASGSDGSSILVATAQAIKASAGQLYGYYAYNPEAAVTFVHFYNVAAASVTVGTTAPLFTLAIPAGSAANLMFPYGVTFSNAGWSCAATTTAGGNTAPATGVSLVAWYM